MRVSGTGATVLTRMPYLPASSLSEFMSPTKPSLAAP
jgi:hypothetical protein